MRRPREEDDLPADATEAARGADANGGQHPDDDWFADLSESAWDRVGAVCDTFEAEWPARPRIERHLVGWTGRERQLLLQQLMEIEIEWRRALGESPTEADYLWLFPQDESAIRRAFQDSPHGHDSAEAAPTITGRDQPGSSNSESSLSFGFKPGTLFGSYELIELVGRGGMGQVWKARHRLGRVVALKVIRPECLLGGTDQDQEESLKRFKAEILAATIVEHDNVIRVYDADAIDGLPYYTMPFVEGETLAQMVKSGPLAPRLAATYILAVTRGVTAAHAQKVIHRDIKPQNILIDKKTNRALLMDFGLAKVMREGAPATMSGWMLGTPQYMAPEQMVASTRSTDAVDIYGLGATMYHLLTGHPPFQGETSEQTIIYVLNSEPVEPRRLNPGVPRDLNTIVMKCLDKNPHHRYASAHELVLELGRFLADQPILARPHSRLERAVRWCRRNPLATSFVGLLVTALVAVSAINARLNHTMTTLTKRNRENQRLLQENDRQIKDIERARREADARLIQMVLGKALDYCNNHLYSDAQEVLERILPVAASKPWDIQYLQRTINDGQSLVTHRRAVGLWGILAGAVDSSAQRVVVSNADGQLTLLDAQSFEIIDHLGKPRIRTEFLDDPLAAPRPWHYLENRDNSNPVTWDDHCFMSVVWSKDSSCVYAASLNGRIIEWNVATGTSRQVAVLGEPLATLQIHPPTGHFLVGGFNGTLWLVNVDGQVIATVTSDGAVSAMLWEPDLRRWVIGRHTGSIESYDESLGDRKPLHTCDGRVWDLSVCRVRNRWSIVVGTRGNQLLFIDCQTLDQELPTVTTWELPPGVESITDIVAARPAPDATRLFLVDNAGHLIVVDSTSMKILNRTLAASSGWRTRRLLEELNVAGLPSGLLERMECKATFLAPVSDNQLLVGGEDATLRLVRVPSSEAPANITLLAASAGERPKIVFDPARDHWLWTLDNHGMLRLIDIQADRALDSHKAHEGGASGLVVLDVETIASVGGDTSVCFWIARDGRIMPAKRKPFVHDTPIISLAVSPTRTQLAVVDVQANLRIWNLQTGETALQMELSTDRTGPDREGRPTTGAVAFNLDGSLLVAAGVFQDVKIIDTKTFDPVAISSPPGGHGLEAAAWSSTDRDVVLLIDDQPSLRINDLHLENKLAIRWQDAEPKSQCRTVCSSPNQQRIVLLERDGLLRFFDAENFVELMQLKIPADVAWGLDTGLAFDTAGERLAAATEAGQIVVLEALPPEPELETYDDRQNWHETRLFENIELVTYSSRSCSLNPIDGRVAVATVVGPDTRTGRLECFFETSAGVRREPPDIPIFATTGIDRQVVALGHSSDGGVHVVWRIEPGETSYEGNVVLGTYAPDNTWSCERVLTGANAGLYPYLETDANRVTAIWHHSMERDAGLALSRRDDAGQWITVPQGEAGDGLQLFGAQIEAAGSNFLWSIRRFAGDNAGQMLGQWNGKELRRHSVPANLQIISAFVCNADGAVYMVAQDLASESDHPQFAVWRFDGRAWTKLLDLPRSIDGPLIGFGPDGTLCLLHIEPRTRKLLHSSFRDGKWRHHHIADLADRPRCVMLKWMTTPSGQPVLVVGRSGDHAWASVFRRIGPWPGIDTAEAIHANRIPP